MKYTQPYLPTGLNKAKLNELNNALGYEGLRLYYPWLLLCLIRKEARHLYRKKALGVYLVNPSSFLVNDFYFPSIDNVYTFNNIIGINTNTHIRNSKLKLSALSIPVSKSWKSLRLTLPFKCVLSRLHFVHKKLFSLKEGTVIYNHIILDTKKKRKNSYYIFNFFKKKLLLNRYILKKTLERSSYIFKSMEASKPKYLKNQVLSKAFQYNDVPYIYNPKSSNYSDFFSKFL